MIDQVIRDSQQRDYSPESRHGIGKTFHGKSSAAQTGGMGSSIKPPLTDRKKKATRNERNRSHNFSHQNL